MASLTVKHLLELKGVRQIAFVQVARESEAIAASTAGMDMIGTGYRTETRHFASLATQPICSQQIYSVRIEVTYRGTPKCIDSLQRNEIGYSWNALLRIRNISATYNLLITPQSSRMFRYSQRSLRISVGD